MDGTRKEGLTTKVKMRITDQGHYYEHDGKVEGPFTLQDEQMTDFDLILAIKLGVEPKDILQARLWEITRPTTFDEVAEVLGSTVRRDKPTKLILLAGMVLTFTDEDQINILMSSESAAGKSYDAVEVAAYFPSEVMRILGSASPTAFYHEEGVFDKNRNALVVDLRGIILIFLDQPHYSLIERLRPLLSHDKRELIYKITDKTKKGALRTKNVILIGYPTVIFCSSKFTLDEQEKTRLFVLSPETSSEKLEESLRLIVARVGDREGFRRWVDSHPRRRWLKARIQAIRDANIKHVIIEGQEYVYKRFRSLHERLAPRHQRDLPRIMALIKAHALFNIPHREGRGQETIVATDEDIEAGFDLYSLIAKPNELGISPQVYEIYKEVIEPLLKKEGSVSRQRILGAYYEYHGRLLAEDRLRREILPSLESAGLIVQIPDPTDRRKMLVSLPDHSNISRQEKILDGSVYHSDSGNQKNHQPPNGPRDDSTQGGQTPHGNKPPPRGET